MRVNTFDHRRRLAAFAVAPAAAALVLAGCSSTANPPAGSSTTTTNSSATTSAIAAPTTGSCGAIHHRVHRDRQHDQLRIVRHDGRHRLRGREVAEHRRLEQHADRQGHLRDVNIGGADNKITFDKIDTAHRGRAQQHRHLQGRRPEGQQHRQGQQDQQGLRRRRSPASADAPCRPAPAAKRSAPDSLGGHPGQAAELEVHRLGLRHPPLVERREPVGAQALLRQRGQLARRVPRPLGAPGLWARRGWPARSPRPRRRRPRRPVRIMSIARLCPISRGSRTVPPSISGTPQRRQKTPKTASSSTTRRSHHSASSRPPATA